VSNPITKVTSVIQTNSSQFRSFVSFVLHIAYCLLSLSIYISSNRPALSNSNTNFRILEPSDSSMETYISIMESADLKFNVDFFIHDTNSWPNWFYVCFIAIIFLGLQILAWIVPTLFGKWSLIAFKKEHHLDEFEPDDRRNIFINKCLTALFVFNVLQVMKHLQEVDKFATGIKNLTLVNFFGAICCFYIFYDFWYTNFHRFLHLGFIYPYIHKHHHRQKVIAPPPPPQSHDFRKKYNSQILSLLHVFPRFLF
jgi:hypothetical protein